MEKLNKEYIIQVLTERIKENFEITVLNKIRLVKEKNLGDEIEEKIQTHYKEKFKIFFEDFEALTKTEEFDHFVNEQVKYNGEVFNKLSNFLNEIKKSPKDFTKDQLNVIKENKNKLYFKNEFNFFDYRLEHGLYFKSGELLKLPQLLDIFYNEELVNFDVEEITSLNKLKEVKSKIFKVDAGKFSNIICKKIEEISKSREIKGEIKYYLEETIQNIDFKKYDKDIIDMLNKLPSLKLIWDKDLEFFKEPLKDSDEDLFVGTNKHKFIYFSHILKTLCDIHNENEDENYEPAKDLLANFNSVVKKMIDLKIGASFLNILIAKMNPSDEYIVNEEFKNMYFQYMKEEEYNIMPSVEANRLLNKMRRGFNNVENYIFGKLNNELNTARIFFERKRLLKELENPESEVFKITKHPSITLSIDFEKVKVFKNLDDGECNRISNPLFTIKKVRNAQGLLTALCTFNHESIEDLTAEECTILFLSNLAESGSRKIDPNDFTIKFNGAIREAVLRKKMSEVEHSKLAGKRRKI